MGEALLSTEHNSVARDDDISPAGRHAPASRSPATPAQARRLIQINAATARLHQKCSKATARMPSRFPSHP